MELCTGGSLFNILDDPINCYGLEEKEFVSVLKHLGNLILASINVAKLIWVTNLFSSIMIM